MNGVLESLRNFVEQLLVLTESLHELLQDEAKYLRSRNKEGLSATTTQKESLVDEINSLIRHKYNELGIRNLEDKGGFDSIFSRLSNSNKSPPQLISDWNKVKLLTKECNFINEQNGAYIALYKQHLQRSLDLLQGRSSSALVYGPDGIGRNQASSSRSLLSV
jgi:flagellar biosynthesis/type III secretory pathway chaperone